jgi:hypothetical protein
MVVALCDAVFVNGAYPPELAQLDMPAMNIFEN